jgi:hypothetical protein
MNDTKLEDFLKFNGYKAVEEMRESFKELLAQCEVDIENLPNAFNEVYEDELWRRKCRIEKALKDLDEVLRSKV